MERQIYNHRGQSLLVILMIGMLAGTTIADAHCDTMNGPVIVDARTALAKNNVAIVLKWIKNDHEQEIITLFTKTAALRKISPEAKEIADRLFFETLVRLHRAGEGVAFTGLKEAEVEQNIQEADHSIETGTADELINATAHKIHEQIARRFKRVMEAKKNVNTSVEQGREYVEAYVQYVHFVEALGTITEDHQSDEHQEQPNHQH
jgi:hypothetical protein